MGKKKVQKVPLGQARQLLLDRDEENAGESSAMDISVITAGLMSEFDTLDSSLILALLSDYPPETIPSELDTIRSQLSILQASAVPDDNDLEVYTEPSQSTSTSDIADILERTSLQAESNDGVDNRDRKMMLPPSSWRETGIKKKKSGKKGNGSAGTSTRLGTDSSVTKSGSGSRSGSGSSGISESGDGGSTSPSSVTGDQGLENEMSLLKSLFPNLKQADLRTALNDAVSVQAAIDQLLSVELINNVEREGAWPGETHLTDDEGCQEVPLKRTTSSNPLEIPTPMSRSASASSRTSISSKRSIKPKQYALIDTLQRVPTPSSHTSSRAQSPAPLQRSYGLSGPAPNAWHTLASLAAQLADLLPPHTEAYFTSFLHSPEYRSAHSAVRGALERLPDTPTPTDSPAEAVLHDLYGLSLTDEDDTRKQADLKAAMRVAGEDVGVVMDLVDLLEEISHWPGDEDNFDRYGSSDDDYEAATRTQPTHVHVSAKPGLPTINSERLTRKPKKKAILVLPKPAIIPGSQPAASSAAFPTAHDDFGTPPASPRMTTPALMPSNRRQVHPQNWRKVEHERLVKPSSTSTTSYPRAPVSMESMSVNDCLERAALERHKRETAIRAAGRHFSGHLPGGKAINASVAGHYAQQARTAGDQARSWELRAARIVVGAQLQQTGTTVDLHHLTTNEAVTVAKETVKSWYDRQRAAWGTGHTGTREGVFVPGKPMTIVTGVGNHSAGKRGVLGPAVAKALEGEGWKVERGENARGYLVIKGRR